MSSWEQVALQLITETERHYRDWEVLQKIPPCTDNIEGLVYVTNIRCHNVFVYSYTYTDYNDNGPYIVCCYRIGTVGNFTFATHWHIDDKLSRYIHLIVSKQISKMPGWLNGWVR